MGNDLSMLMEVIKRFIRKVRASSCRVRNDELGMPQTRVPRYWERP